MVALGLGLVAVLLAFLIGHDVLFPAAARSTAPRTATVTRATIRSAVSGTGTVQPATQQSVNFSTAGTVSEVDVKAGDQVKQGQVLARLDPTTLQQALDQASNSLQQAQATVNSTVNGNAVVQAEHSLANAQQSLSDVQAQVSLTNQQDANAVAADQANLASDQANLSSANARLSAAHAANDSLVATAQAALQASQFKYQADGCGDPTNVDPQHQALCQQDFVAIEQAQAALDQAQAPISAAQAAVGAAQAAVNADAARLTQDQGKQASDQVSGQRSLNQAQAQVTTAQDALNSQTIQRPNTIASQQASVANAQLAVQTAQRNLSAATLTAPFDGTVLSITGQVGGTVSGTGATSAATSGAASQSAGSGGGGSSSTASSASSSSSSGFVLLGNVSGMQVTVPFAEADAARLEPNQQATVTFDAVSGLSLPAHVMSVDAVATVISNVTNYYANLVLDRVDGRLKTGMTANSNVVVQQVTNVLTLPNSAITRIGGSAFVNLLGRDGRTETRQPIEIGAVSDSQTEVVSGLNLGDQVVLPQLRTTTTGQGAGGLGAGRTGGGAGGAGGGGGVRIGGG